MTQITIDTLQHQSITFHRVDPFLAISSGNHPDDLDTYTVIEWRNVANQVCDIVQSNQFYVANKIQRFYEVLNVY